MHLGAALVALANHLKRRHRLAHAKFHEMNLAFAAYGQAQPFRQRIYNGHSDSMQPAGNLVRTGIEFSAGMQYGHDDFCR